MDEPLTLEFFTPYVGQRCEMEGYSVPLVLASATPHPRSAAPGSVRVPFSLIFEGPPNEVVPQGLHRVAIQDGPVVEIYVLPIHTIGRDRQDYQATFN